MEFELRNIKCTFLLNTLSDLLLSKFEKSRYNLILRLEQSVILTVYPSSSNRVHATGIKNMRNLLAIKSLFHSTRIKIRDIVVDNTYWIRKPHIIDRFHEFASFCERYRESGEDIDLDMSNFALNGDGYLNTIYLKHRKASGTVIIHRKCISILGAKNSSSVLLLSDKVNHLFKKYAKVTQFIQE